MSQTIGDAYLAIAGLPQRLDDVSRDKDPGHTMVMVHFASTVVQLFSGRYVQPDATEVLKLVAQRSVLQRKTAGVLDLNVLACLLSLRSHLLLPGGGDIQVFIFFVL